MQYGMTSWQPVPLSPSAHPSQVGPVQVPLHSQWNFVWPSLTHVPSCLHGFVFHSQYCAGSVQFLPDQREPVVSNTSGSSSGQSQEYPVLLSLTHAAKQVATWVRKVFTVRTLNPLHRSPCQSMVRRSRCKCTHPDQCSCSFRRVGRGSCSSRKTELLSCTWLLSTQLRKCCILGPQNCPGKRMHLSLQLPFGPQWISAHASSTLSEALDS